MCARAAKFRFLYECWRPTFAGRIAPMPLSFLAAEHLQKLWGGPWSADDALVGLSRPSRDRFHKCQERVQGDPRGPGTRAKGPPHTEDSAATPTRRCAAFLVPASAARPSTTSPRRGCTRGCFGEAFWGRICAQNAAGNSWRNNVSTPAGESSGTPGCASAESSFGLDGEAGGGIQLLFFHRIRMKDKAAQKTFRITAAGACVPSADPD